MRRSVLLSIGDHSVLLLCWTESMLKASSSARRSPQPINMATIGVVSQFTGRRRRDAIEEPPALLSGQPVPETNTDPPVNESGRMEVYVQGFPEPGERWQVSTTGGSQPRWRRDGAELFYVAANGMLMATSVRASATGASPLTGTPVALFVARIVSSQGGLLRHQYAVTADGTRFLLNAEGAASAPITVIANWRGFTLLR